MPILPSGAVGGPSVEIYCDGSALGNPGPGGYGAILVYGNTRKEISAGYQHTTNNRMEIRRALHALELLSRPCDVIIFTDSRYVCDSIEKNWVNGWAKRGWMTANCADQPGAYPLPRSRNGAFRKWVLAHDQDRAGSHSARLSHPREARRPSQHPVVFSPAFPFAVAPSDALSQGSFRACARYRGVHPLT